MIGSLLMGLFEVFFRIDDRLRQRKQERIDENRRKVDAAEERLRQEFEAAERVRPETD